MTSRAAPAERDPKKPELEEPEALLTLERAPEAWLDRALPAHPKAFVVVTLALSLGVWVLGWVLAPDKRRFLASREWQLQPLYLATHLVVLRLFVTAYVTHFLQGASHLEIATAEAKRRVRRVLGPIGALVALAVAAPLAWMDFGYAQSPEWARSAESVGERAGATNLLLAGVWSLEWVLNAYVWVVLVGFLGLTMRVLKKHAWKGDLETVLHERHYRPFLLMSAQGASVVLGFTIATATYMWLTHGEPTDYVGLWVTGALLVMGFVPPWMRLKNDLARRMREEVFRLRQIVIAARKTQHRVDDRAPPTTLEEIGARMDVAMALLEVDHLERLYRDLGKSEGQAVLLRLLAPLSTVAWQVIKPG